MEATLQEAALDRTAPVPIARPTLLGFAEARAVAAADPRGPLAVLAGWVETYLMKGHAELGRTGAVCPFTRQAARLDTARLMVSPALPGDEDAVFALIRSCFAELDAIPAAPGMAHFRTVIVGFPGCTAPAGIAMLESVQRRHKFYSLARSRMIGLMHTSSEAQGLWNAEFRPLRAPIPVLAIRHMVEQDAPFAARHPLLILPYLARFRLGGLAKLAAHWRGRR